MGFRSTVFTALLLIAADAFCLSVRPTWNGDSAAQYIWFALHAIILLLEGAVMFAFLSGTVWFNAGLVDQLMYTMKGSLPLWIFHLIFTIVPWIWQWVPDTPSRLWESGAYAFLFVLDYTLSIAFYVSFMFTMCCMTEKRMYDPYHKEMGFALHQKNEQWLKGKLASGGTVASQAPDLTIGGFVGGGAAAPAAPVPPPPQTGGASPAGMVPPTPPVATPPGAPVPQAGNQPPGVAPPPGVPGGQQLPPSALPSQPPSAQISHPPSAGPPTPNVNALQPMNTNNMQPAPHQPPQQQQPLQQAHHQQALGMPPLAPPPRRQ